MRGPSGLHLIPCGHCDKWLPEVKKQTLKAGASVELNIIYRGAIQKAVQKHAKDHPESGKKFLVRTIDDTTVGVWRTA